MRERYYGFSMYGVATLLIILFGFSLLTTSHAFADRGDKGNGRHKEWQKHQEEMDREDRRHHEEQEREAWKHEREQERDVRKNWKEKQEDARKYHMDREDRDNYEEQGRAVRKHRQELERENTKDNRGGYTHGKNEI